MSAVRPFDLPGLTTFGEPALRFDARNPRAISLHPLEGLRRYGPYSSGSLSVIPDPIRVALVVPHRGAARASGFLQELERPQPPKERPNYLIDFPGFSRLFRVGLGQAVGVPVIELPADMEARMRASERPYLPLVEALTAALRTLRQHAFDFDIILLVLSRAWESGFESAEDGFDLHDHLKAVAASDGLCIQLIKEHGGLDYRCRCSVAWRMGIALYAKAGGVPWVLADVDPTDAYIGISYAMRKGSGGNFAICCSQVFDAEGSGLEFIAYEASDVRLYGRNPFLSREQMLRVMSRSMDIYRRKHAGVSPRRVFVHKTTEFKREEIDGCFDALGAIPQVELVQVQERSGWRGVLITAPQTPHAYPCHRGTAVQMGSYETLLWTHGNAPSVSGKNYLKGGKGTPAPLLLVRHAGHGGMDDICRSTLALTRMNWNNDGPYDDLPVTLTFAQTLARIVQRMPRLEPRPYPVRLFT